MTARDSGLRELGVTRVPSGRGGRMGEARLLRALVILPYSPNKIRVRSLSNLRDISQAFETDLVYLDDGLSALIPQQVHSVVRVNNRSHIRRFFRVLYGLVCGKPITFQYYHALSLPPLLARLDLSLYDLVFVERLPLHELGLNHPNVVFDAVDCFTSQVALLGKARTLRQPLYVIDSFLIGRHECAACNAASRVLVTTTPEARKLRKLGVKTHIVAQLHALGIHPAETARRSRPGIFLLTFHGKLDYLPNRLALDVIRRRVRPALDSSYRIQVVGHASKRIKRKFRDLGLTGYVEDLQSTIAQADLGIFPIEYCVGVQNKVIETLACGVPCLVTPQMIEGLPNPKELLERGLFVAEVATFPQVIRHYRALDSGRQHQIKRACLRYASQLDDRITRLRSLAGDLGSSELHLPPEPPPPDPARAAPPIPASANNGRAEL